MSNYNEHMTNEARLVCDNEESIYFHLRDAASEPGYRTDYKSDSDIAWLELTTIIVFDMIPNLTYMKNSDFDPSLVDIKALAFDLYQYHINEH